MNPIALFDCKILCTKISHVLTKSDTVRKYIHVHNLSGKELNGLYLLKFSFKFVFLRSWIHNMFIYRLFKIHIHRVVSLILHTCDTLYNICIPASTMAEVEFPFRAARFMTVHTRRRVAVWKYERLYFASWIRTFVIFLRTAESGRTPHVHVWVCLGIFLPRLFWFQSVFFSCRSVFLPPGVESSRSSGEGFSKLPRLWFNYETDTNTVWVLLVLDSFVESADVWYL